MVAPAASSPAARRSSWPAAPSSAARRFGDRAAQGVPAAERVGQRERHLRHSRIHRAAVAPAPGGEDPSHGPGTGGGQREPRERSRQGGACDKGSDRSRQQQPAALGRPGRAALAPEAHEHVDEAGQPARDPRAPPGHRGGEPRAELDTRAEARGRGKECEKHSRGQDTPSLSGDRAPPRASRRLASGPGPGRRSSPPRL